MLIEEIYDLCGLVLKYNKRELKLFFKADVTVSYFYNGILKGNIKLISIQRLHRFMDKYRGLQIRGYNRPVMYFKKFNIKTCEEIQE